MPTLFWPFLNALQAGALLAVTLSFGAEGWTRRDRMMGALALACGLVAMRHGLIAGAEIGALDPAWTLKAQSLLVCLGFVVLLEVGAILFPRYVSKRLPWVALVLFIPNLARNLLLEASHRLDRPFHQAANFAYIGLFGYLMVRVLRACRDREPMARRLLVGLVGVTSLGLLEAGLETALGQKIRLSGFGLLFFATVLGASWQWVRQRDLEARLASALVRAEAWRGLIPGPTWDAAEPSPLMDGLFGEGWRNGLPPLHRSLDGQLYDVFETKVQDGVLGWIRVTREAVPHAGFLTGWTLAVGMDEPGEVSEWIKSWGAEVEPWGTLPPREGPYPSILLWAREPSILAVWRENDLLRRRPRWVQVGGPITEGPHLRLETPLRREELEQGLRRLLSV